MSVDFKISSNLLQGKTSIFKNSKGMYNINFDEFF